MLHLHSAPSYMLNFYEEVLHVFFLTNSGNFKMSNKCVFLKIEILIIEAYHVNDITSWLVGQWVGWLVGLSLCQSVG